MPEGFESLIPWNLINNRGLPHLKYHKQTKVKKDILSRLMSTCSLTKANHATFAKYFQGTKHGRLHRRGIGHGQQELKGMA